MDREIKTPNPISSLGGWSSVPTGNPSITNSPTSSLGGWDSVYEDEN